MSVLSLSRQKEECRKSLVVGTCQDLHELRWGPQKIVLSPTQALQLSFQLSSYLAITSVSIGFIPYAYTDRQELNDRGTVLSVHCFGSGVNEDWTSSRPGLQEVDNNYLINSHKFFIKKMQEKQETIPTSQTVRKYITHRRQKLTF